VQRTEPWPPDAHDARPEADIAIQATNDCEDLRGARRASSGALGSDGDSHVTL
jgi:hypothetical protein